MKLEQAITINPPPFTDPNTNKIVSPPALVFDTLDITFHDNPTGKVVSATVRNIPGSFIIASGIDYEKLGDINRSTLSRLFWESIKDNPTQKLREKFPKTLEENPNGPGTLLTNMISTLGIKSTPNCSCRRHALEMNEKGNDWCEQNLPTILGWLKEESAKRNLPYIESVASMIVKRAIRNSRRLTEQSNG